MSEQQAHKVQNTKGVKSNRNVPKENYVSRHKKSKVSHVDERNIEIEIRLTHSHRGVMVKRIELYRLEAEKARWERDNWEVSINN